MPEEKHFWTGVMDTDGMIARNARKITLWSASQKLVNSFANYLKRQSIPCARGRRIINGTTYHVVRIKSCFTKAYRNTIGFEHPRKKKWLKRHCQGEFYLQNKVNLESVTHNGLFDYYQILNDRVFVVGVKDLAKEYGLHYTELGNSKFSQIYGAMASEGLKRHEIYKRLVPNYRFKMSKGSTANIWLPLAPNSQIERIAKFARIRTGGIGISRRYVEAWNEDYKGILSDITEIFGLDPQTTCKGEAIFSSCVLRMFFEKIVSVS